MSSSIFQTVSSCINSFIEIFQENPHDFLYEADIRAVLYSELKSEFKKTTKRIRLPVELHTNQIRNGYILTDMVKAEYPYGKLFDIAFIHPESKRHKTSAHKNDAWWIQNLLGAIEVKHYRLGDKIDDRLKGFVRDIRKLMEYKPPEEKFDFKFGLALLFLQSSYGEIEVEITKCIGNENIKIVNEVDQVPGIYGYIIRGAEKTKYKITLEASELEEIMKRMSWS